MKGAETEVKKAQDPNHAARRKRSVFTLWLRWLDSPNGLALLLLGKRAFKTAITAALAYVVAQNPGSWWETR